MTKRDRVFKLLKSGGCITKLMAIKKFSLINLGDAIHVFRSKGYDISTVMAKSAKGESYAIYFMERAERVRLSLREAG